MAKFTFHKYQGNVASVVKVDALDNATTIDAHTLVQVIADVNNSDALTVYLAANDPVAGDFLVWRPYPDYNIPGDRYGKIAKTPIATSTGELYGFVLKTGDELIDENGSLVIVAAE